MKALRWYGIHDVRTEEIEKPVPAAGEVLIRVLYAGICGSDLHIYNKGMFIQNVPETMGHEFCGVVEEAYPAETASPEACPAETVSPAACPAETVSSAACEAETASSAACAAMYTDPAQSFAPGDYVIANPMITCGTCESCLAGHENTCENLGFIGEVRQGCFAEYIALPADRLIRVPSGADMEKIALAEPLAVAVNVCRRAALSPQDSLAVVGAGPIGLLTAAVAISEYGVRDVTVVNRSEPRRRIAEKLGATAVAAIPEGQRFDKVVEAAGSPATLNMALQAVRPNGQVLAVSVFEEDCAIDANLIVGAQITLTGCNCYGREDLETAVGLIAGGRVDVAPIITDVVTIDEGKAAFEKLCAREKQAAKILFTFS